MLICGIDPGLTTAYALLDFDGNIVAINSKKYFGLNKFIKAITSYGKISVIATDVDKIPNFVLKIAKELRTIIIKPERRISMKKKREIVKEFSKVAKQVKNKHELVALCAAILAYKYFSPSLNKIKNLKIEEEEKAKIFLGLLTKKYANIKEAKKDLNI